VREVLNIDLSKQQQSSDWGAQALERGRNWAYAASRRAASPWLARTAGYHARRAPRGPHGVWRKPCFRVFLPTRAKLDLQGLGYRGHFRPFLRSRRDHLKAPSRSAQRDSKPKPAPDLIRRGDRFRLKEDAVKSRI